MVATRRYAAWPRARGARRPARPPAAGARAQPLGAISVRVTERRRPGRAPDHAARRRRARSSRSTRSRPRAASRTSFASSTSRSRNLDSDGGGRRCWPGCRGVVKVEARKTLGQIFGKRVIVIGGGAQVAQVAPRRRERGGPPQPARRADQRRHHRARRRGDRSPTPSAPSPTCRAPTSSSWPARSWAARSRRPCASSGPSGIPVIALNMAGSVPDAADLVVTRSGPGRHDGRDGDRRHGALHARPPARAEVLA